MAYVLSQKLLDRIYDDLQRGETLDVTRSKPQPEVPQQTEGRMGGWFVLSDPLTLSGEAEMTPCVLQPCPDGSPYLSGYTSEPRFSGEPTRAYDLLWRCTTEVPAASIVYCEKIQGFWAFVRAVNTPNYGSASFAPAPSALPTGDPQSQFVGKTTSAWAKGTTTNVQVYYQSGTTWYPLAATAVGATVTANVTVNCYNRYADVGTDKWVRVTGGGELVSAEC